MGLLLLLSACSGEFDQASGDPSVADWGGPAGNWLELTPEGAPDSLPLLLSIDEDGWELRYGDTWSSAQEQGLLPVTVDATGYQVDDSLLVPAGLEVGSSAQGTTILERGTVEVWYGTFDDALVVDVGEGTFRGEAAFAVEVGPIRLTWEGRTWELAYYER